MSLTVDRHLDAWSTDHPTALVHLPSGLGLKVSTYSSSAGAYEDHATTETVRFLDKTRRLQRLVLHHAGSRVGVDVVRDGPFDLLIRCRLLEPGEWALRFWILLEIGRIASPTAPALDQMPGSRTRVQLAPAGRHASPTGKVAASWRSTHLAVHTAPAPARSGTYQQLSELAAELDEGGYYLPHDDAEDPRWAVLRFSTQEQAQVLAAVALRPSGDQSAEAADDLLVRSDELLRWLETTEPERTEPASSDRGTAHSEHASPALAAIRDVVGWNTVWDRPNNRPYTAPTRNWLGQKFGGYGVWLTDVAYAGLLAAVAGDPVMARANLLTVLAGQQPAGTLPGLLTANEEWVDRSQPPVIAFLLRRIHAMWPDTSLLHAALPTLGRSYRWWMSARDGNDNGLIEYGSSPTGQGTFRHTRQAALNESSMDNLPMFDDVSFDPDRGTLQLEDPGLNSLLVLEAESLAALHAELGDHSAAARYKTAAAEHASRIRTELWDPERRIFAARRWDGTFARSLSPTSFYPLIAGVASDEQAATLVSEHLLDETSFWGPRPLPASTFDDPASADRVYWRGRVWPPMVYLTWEGLRRYGFDSEAAELAHRTWTMFADGWAERRCLENFDPDGPDGDRGPDVDDLYTWGALLPLVAHLNRSDVNPWRGTWLDATDGVATTVVGGRTVRLEAQPGGARLIIGDRTVGDLKGANALCGIALDEPRLRLEVPAGKASFVPAGTPSALRRGDGAWTAWSDIEVELRAGEAVELLEA